MRTTLEIDDKLLAEAKQRTGLLSDTAVVEEALLTLVRLRRQREIMKLQGKVAFVDDAEEQRAP